MPSSQPISELETKARAFVENHEQLKECDSVATGLALRNLFLAAIDRCGPITWTNLTVGRALIKEETAALVTASGGKMHGDNSAWAVLVAFEKEYLGQNLAVAR